MATSPFLHAGFSVAGSILPTRAANESNERRASESLASNATSLFGRAHVIGGCLHRNLSNQSSWSLFRYLRSFDFCKGSSLNVRSIKWGMRLPWNIPSSGYMFTPPHVLPGPPSSANRLTMLGPISSYSALVWQ